LHRRMTSQLVALATQARKAAGVEWLDELDELDDDELPDPHMSISARRQLELPFELVKEVEVAKQVPHLAMMLSTAFTHIDDEDEMEDGQPVRPTEHKRENTTPTKARFTRHPHEKLFAKYILAGPKRSISATIPTQFAAMRPAPKGVTLPEPAPPDVIWTRGDPHDGIRLLTDGQQSARSDPWPISGRVEYHFMKAFGNCYLPDRPRVDNYPRGSAIVAASNYWRSR
jgi:hypothetical protein